MKKSINTKNILIRSLEDKI